jgi:hypothetical protein
MIAPVAGARIPHHRPQIGFKGQSFAETQLTRGPHA